MPLSANSKNENHSFYSWKELYISLAFLALTLFVLSIMFSIAFAPAFTPLLWEIVFETAAGWIFSFVALSSLTVGLCGLALHLSPTNPLTSVFPKNKYLSAALQGGITLGLGVIPLVLFSLTMLPLSPVMWAMASLALGFSLMASGIRCYSQLVDNDIDDEPRPANDDTKSGPASPTYRTPVPPLSFNKGLSALNDAQPNGRRDQMDWDDPPDTVRATSQDNTAVNTAVDKPFQDEPGYRAPSPPQ